MWLKINNMLSDLYTARAFLRSIIWNSVESKSIYIIINYIINIAYELLQKIPDAQYLTDIKGKTVSSISLPVCHERIYTLIPKTNSEIVDSMNECYTLLDDEIDMIGFLNNSDFLKLTNTWYGFAIIQSLRVWVNNVQLSYLCSSFKNGMMPYLKEFDISGNYLGNTGINVLCENFKYLTQLRILNLNNNFIGEDGIKSISKYLSILNNLECLSLDLPFFTIDIFNTLHDTVHFLPYQPAIYIGNMFINTSLLPYNELLEYALKVTKTEYSHPFDLNNSRNKKITSLITPRGTPREKERDPMSIIRSETELAYRFRCLKNLKTLYVSVCRLTGNRKIDDVLLSNDPDSDCELIFSRMNVSIEEFHVLLATLLFYRKIKELSVYQMKLGQNQMINLGKILSQGFPYIKRLYLNDNNCGPQGAKAIASAFPYLPSLKELLIGCIYNINLLFLLK